MFIKRPPYSDVLASYGLAASASLPRRITVTVWNCHKCRHQDWENDFAHVNRDSDILLLQEVRLTPALERLFTLPGFGWHMAQSFFSFRHGYACGVATGTPACSREVFFLAEEREPFVRTHKMILGTVYNLNGTPLLALNVHGINFTPSAAFKRQMSGAGRALAAFPGPVIFAGDFNAWSKTRRKILFAMAAEAGMTELHFHPDTRSRHLRHPVDHIFTRGLKTVSAQVLDNINSSDHRPLRACLELPPQVTETQ